MRKDYITIPGKPKMNETFDEMNGLIFFYRLHASNCKGVKNTNLVISSKQRHTEVPFVVYYPL